MHSHNKLLVAFTDYQAGLVLLPYKLISRINPLSQLFIIFSKPMGFFLLTSGEKSLAMLRHPLLIQKKMHLYTVTSKKSVGSPYINFTVHIT